MAYRGFIRPTIDEIRSRVYSDINNRLPGQDASLQFTVLNALAEAIIGIAHELYGYLEWIARQTNVLDCEDINLDLYSQIWSVIRKPPTYAQGTVTFSGLDGSIVPAGTIVQTSSGLQYKTDADGEITGGFVEVGVTSLLTGSAYNLNNNTEVTLVNPVAGINTTLYSGPIFGGADVEIDEDVRARLLERISFPPQGGCKQDYVNWALEVPGVTRAWCYPEEDGAGTVKVRFMTDLSTANGIPLDGDVTLVQDYIDPLKPVTASLTVAKPTAVPLNVTVTGLSPNTATTRLNAENEILAMLRRKAEPGGTIRISWIWEAVSLATGTEYHHITAPAADVTHTVSQIAVPGTVTFA